MHKHTRAEGMLSLVMPRSAAQALVGDCLETHGAHSRGWLWLKLAGCGLSYLARDIRDHALMLVGLAVQGAVVQFTVLCGALLIAQYLGPMWFGWPFESGSASWIALSGVVLFVAPLVAGRWVARRAPGRVAAVCVVLAVSGPFLLAAFNAIFLWAIFWGQGYAGKAPPLWLYWWQAGFIGPYLLGGLTTRPWRQTASLRLVRG